ncbi:MAG: polyamine aminopropyltransferase [Calditrichia bacterium]
MGIRFTELTEGTKSGFSMEIKSVLFNEQSPFQKVSVIDTEGFGKVLLIDDLIMLTERDEFVYHEMIAHVPLYNHPNPESVLIIGGGDGGTARECARHSIVKTIDLVDIDEMVTTACRAHMQTLTTAIDSGRVNCEFQDGVAYVKESDRKYDVVIIDSTDPIAVGEGLFTREFYQDCFAILKDDGILVNQSESPSWQPEEVRKISQKLHELFPHVGFFQAHIPTYPSGHWIFGFASKQYRPFKDFQATRYSSDKLKMNYYNDELHRGAFMLPTFVRELVKNVE